MDYHSILEIIKSEKIKDADYSVENGMVVIKKMKGGDPSEELFFNKGYLTKIGLPDAKVFVGKLSSDGIMTGGYYEKMDDLTYPFKIFATMIQGQQNKNVEYEPQQPVEYEGDSNTSKPGFFERLGNYGSQISTGVNSGIGNLRSYFGKKTTESTEPTEQVAEKSTAEISSIEEDKQKIPESEHQTIQEPIQKPVDDAAKNDEYLMVRIPIKEDEIVPLGKYEKMEEMFKQMEMKRKANKELNEEYSKIKEFVLPVGSYMDKVSKVRVEKRVY